MFGSTLPTIVCAPLYVCDLALQEGEAVNDLNVGDSVRWKITPATQGAGDTLITHVMIKPTDVGLVTNLVITTNRRTYIVKLVSRERDWMPRVAFDYPGRREYPVASLPVEPSRTNRPSPRRRPRLLLRRISISATMSRAMPRGSPSGSIPMAPRPTFCFLRR